MNLEQMNARVFPRTYYNEYQYQGYRIVDLQDKITALWEWHYHDFYELSIIVESSNVNYCTESQEYPLRSGDVIFCNMFEPHRYKIMGRGARCERFNVGVEFTKLMEYSNKDANLSMLFQNENRNYPLLHLEFNKLLPYYQLITMYREYRKRAENVSSSGVIPMWENSCLRMLFSYLYVDAGCELTENNADSSQALMVTTEILKYIHNHYSEELSLPQLANEVNYSVSYICTAFKSITNKTINAYIKEKRLETAMCLIRDGMSITEASSKVGFNNYSNFYKLFKKFYGFGPAEARKN